MERQLLTEEKSDWEREMDGLINGLTLVAVSQPIKPVIDGTNLTELIKLF